MKSCIAFPGLDNSRIEYTTYYDKLSLLEIIYEVLLL